MVTSGPQVAVTPKGEGDPLSFEVTVREGATETSHDVTVGRADWQRLSREGESPDEFVRRCFEFLLRREPKESILESFDVSVVSGYFPEFEEEIAR
jgi:hypothetical protein